ncbi:MAG TPA: cell wall hydrolase [Allosphingosinicella sp.]
MIRPIRAAAYAAGVLAFAASAVWGSPLQAWQGDAPVAHISYVAHETAAAGVSDLGLNDDAAVPAPAADASAVPATPSAGIETAAHAVAELPRPPVSLEVQVQTLAGADPHGDEEDCLAAAVYFEARGETLQGQLAVAEVVINRSASGRYPTSFCGVVRQAAQFSFVRRGVIPRADRSSDAWRKAVAIARIAEAGDHRLLPTDVLWYHADYVSPSWGRRLARNTRIGAHIFYS